MAQLSRLVLAAALAFSLAAACGGDDDDDSTPTEGRPDPAVLVSEAADRFAAVKSFHFVLEHEEGRSPIALGLEMERAEGDMVVPDRLQADVEAVAGTFGNASVDVRAVAVGDTVKVTNPFRETEWVELPGSTSVRDLFDPAGGIVSALRAAKDPVLTGEEGVGGAETWVITANVDGADLEAFAPTAEPGYPVKGTVWIGKDDQLVRRVRLEGPFGEDDPDEVIRVVTLSAFDEPITIELP
jgi:hypothetical protein